MSETARISYNTPGLQTVSESPAAERPSTALRPPDADRAKKLQKRLDCEPESATELKKIEEKFKWLHSANRRDSKGRSATVCYISLMCTIYSKPHIFVCVGVLEVHWLMRLGSYWNHCSFRIRHMMVPAQFKFLKPHEQSSPAVRSSTGR